MRLILFVCFWCAEYLESCIEKIVFHEIAKGEIIIILDSTYIANHIKTHEKSYQSIDQN